MSETTHFIFLPKKKFSISLNLSVPFIRYYTFSIEFGCFEIAKKIFYTHCFHLNHLDHVNVCECVNGEEKEENAVKINKNLSEQKKHNAERLTQHYNIKWFIYGIQEDILNKAMCTYSDSHIQYVLFYILFIAIKFTHSCMISL